MKTKKKERVKSCSFTSGIISTLLFVKRLERKSGREFQEAGNSPCNPELQETELSRESKTTGESELGRASRDMPGQHIDGKAL